MTREELIAKIKASTLFGSLKEEKQAEVLGQDDSSLQSYLTGLEIAEKDFIGLKKEYVKEMEQADTTNNANFKKAKSATLKNAEQDMQQKDEAQADTLINNI